MHIFNILRLKPTFATTHLLFIYLLTYSLIVSAQESDTTVCNYELSTAITNVSCYNGSNGNATVASTGCTCVFSGCTFKWSNGETFHTAEGLSAGTYGVTVTHPDGCINETTVEVREPASFIQSASATPVSCTELSDGRASVTPTTTAGPLTYLWSNEATSRSVEGLETGDYSVTITNFLGCEQVEKVTVEVGEPAILDFSAITPACGGLANGAVSVLVNGGTPPYQYLWNDASNQTIPTATNLQSGYYIVTVTDDNGCVFISEEVAIPESAFEASIVANKTKVCAGEQVNLTVSEGKNIVWSPTTGLSNPNSANPTVTLTETMTYQVTLENEEGCTGTAQITLEVAPEPQPEITAGIEQTICSGGSVQLIALDPNGALFSWSPTTGLNNPNINAPTATPTESTVYTVTARNINGCEAETSIYINVEVCASIEDVVEVGGISVYPNPTDDILQVQFATKQAEPVQVQLFNAIGQVMYSRTNDHVIGDFRDELNVKGYSNGLYYLVVQIGGEQWAERVVVY